MGTEVSALRAQLGSTRRAAAERTAAAALVEEESMRELLGLRAQLAEVEAATLASEQVKSLTKSYTTLPFFCPIATHPMSPPPNPHV